MTDKETSRTQFNDLWNNSLVFISGSEYKLSKYIWDESLKFFQNSNMSQHNLNILQCGQNLVTESGLPVLLICVNRTHKDYKIVGLVSKTSGEQDVEEFTETGNPRYCSEYRLKIDNRKYFINIGKDDDGVYWTSRLFSTYQEAKTHSESIIPGGVDTFIKTVEIILDN